MTTIACPNCRTSLDIEPEGFGQLQTCPACNEVFDAPGTSPTAAPAMFRPKPFARGTSEHITSRRYLQQVRANSNYGTLRGLLHAVAVIGCLGVIGAGIARGLATSVHDPEAIPAALIALVLAVLGVVVVIAVYQAALTLVDLADIAADQGRRPH